MSSANPTLAENGLPLLTNAQLNNVLSADEVFMQIGGVSYRTTLATASYLISGKQIVRPLGNIVSDTLEIKNAIAQTKAAGLFSLKLAAGDFYYGESISLCGASDGSQNGQFQTFDLSGSGMGYADTLQGTVIHHETVVNHPALVIQRGRAATISDLQLIGPNTQQPTVNGGEPTLNLADYQTPGVRYNRYSPQCAIAIDPRGSATSIADVDKYPGWTYSETNVGGSNIVNLNRLVIRNSLVGVAVGTSGYTLQGSSVTLDGVNVFGGYVGLAIGHSQARGLRMLNCNIGNCMKGIVGTEFGAQQGVPPTIRNGEFGNIYYVFDLNMVFGSPLYVDGLSIESVKSLGILGVGSSSNKTPAVFTGVRGQMEDATWSLAPFLLQTSSPVSMIACAFASPASGGGQLDNDYKFRSGDNGTQGGRDLLVLDNSCHFGQGNLDPAGGTVLRNGYSRLRFISIATGIEYASEIWNNRGNNHFVI